MTNAPVSTAPVAINTESAYQRYFNRLHNLLIGVSVLDSARRVLTIDEAVSKVLDLLLRVQQEAGKVILIGNGGSAAIASHQALDFTNAAGIPALAFSDSAQLTCFSNDFGYENVYSKAIELYGQANDALIAISSSGRSQNILNGVAMARKKGCSVITFTGFSKQAPLLSDGDLNFYVDSSNYGPVEIAHLALIHYFTDTLAAKRRGVTL